jgi:hypothetical protein
MIRATCIGLCFLIACATPLAAQQDTASTGPVKAKPQIDTAAFTMKKSPWGAVLRSAIIPGWGQLYNESYWKIPVVLGLTGFLAYGIVSEHQSFIDYRDRYAATVTASNPSGNLLLKQFREYYRNNRDSYGWWFLIFYLVQTVDAYVDAQLYDFDVSDEVHAGLHVTPSGRLSLSVSW